MFWVCTLLAAAHGQPVPCTLPALAADIEASEVAFAAREPWRFEPAVDQATRSLVCLEEPIDVDLSARFHRLRAILAFTLDQRSSGVDSLRAVRALQPGYQWPIGLIGPEHPLRKWDQEAERHEDRRRTLLPPPTSGWTTYDGFRQQSAPLGRPFIFQWLVGSTTPAEVRITRYVSSTKLLPAGPWEPPAGSLADAPSDAMDDAVPVEPRRRRGLKKALVGTAISVGFIGGSMLAGSVMTNDSATRAQEAGEFERAKQLEAKNHKLFVAGLTATGLGASLFGVTFVL